MGKSEKNNNKDVLNTKLKPTAITSDRVFRRAQETFLAPYVIITAFRLQELGMSPEEGITWARTVFERNPSQKILAVYSEILDDYYTACNNNDVKEFVAKLQDIDQETLDKVRKTLFVIGVHEDERDPEQIRINFVSRLLYLYYSLESASVDDLNKFTKIYLERFDKLFMNLVELSKNGEGILSFESIDPDDDTLSISKQADDLIKGLEEMLGKRAKFESWKRKNKKQK